MSIDWTQMITAEDKEAEAEAKRLKGIDAAVAAKLNEVAKERGYNSSDGLISWALSNNPVFQAEAANFALWRDAVWAVVMAMPQASVEDVMVALPEPDWNAVQSNTTA